MGTLVLRLCARIEHGLHDVAGGVKSQRPTHRDSVRPIIEIPQENPLSPARVHGRRKALQPRVVIPEAFLAFSRIDLVVRMRTYTYLIDTFYLPPEPEDIAAPGARTVFLVKRHRAA